MSCFAELMDGIRVACIRHGSSHSPQPALVHGDKVHVLGSVFPGGVADLISAVHEATLTGSKQLLEALLARATDVLPLRSVTLCAPLPASCTVVRVPVCVLTTTTTLFLLLLTGDQRCRCA